MRNGIKFIISIMILVCCSGCGEKEIDPLSKDTMDKIDTIGEVTIEDQDLIDSLMETYAGMTDNQKEQVKNYVTLKNAKESLDKLVATENEKKFEKQRPYYENVQTAINTAKNNMKHPASFKVGGVIVLVSPPSLSSEWSVFIEYESENDLGNSVSDYGEVSAGMPDYFGTKYADRYLDYENDIKNTDDPNLEDNEYTYENANGTFYVFKLDFDDYISQGYSGIE